MGITYGNFTGSNKETPVNSTILTKLVTDFGVDAHWLLTGEGSPQGLQGMDTTKGQHSYLDQLGQVLQTQINALEGGINQLAAEQKK